MLRGKANPAYKHGKQRSPTWQVWVAMLGRCYTPTNTAFPAYGGRGIKVCKAWFKFENFLADMGVRPSGATLERKDNEGNYEPGNCRWATHVEQCRNRRSTRWITLDGETKSLAEWVEIAGVAAYPTVHARLQKGWDEREAIWTSTL